MRYSGNIFENGSYRGTGIRTASGVKMVTSILSGISVLAAILIIANFGAITAKIAIGTANFLSSGFPVLLIIIAAIYFVMKLKWRMRRRFWGW